MDQSTKKVYINPNFQRSQGSMPPNNVSVHVNPNFQQNMPSVQTSNTVNSKTIYVNPNFINIKNTVCAQNNHINELQSTIENKASKYNMDLYKPSLQEPIASTSKSRYSLVHHKNNYKIKENQPLNKAVAAASTFKVNKYKSSLQEPVASTSKSRYSLVHHKHDYKIKENQPLNKVVSTASTFKINKYKSVSIPQMKKNYQAETLTEKPSKIAKQQKTHWAESRNSKKVHDVYASRYKFVKKKSVDTPVQLINRSMNRKLSSSFTKVNSCRTNNRTKSTINRTNYKKNNMPCPLFRKFGKCLRNIQGKCELLHDKKHVSICRKFLKGICYDMECLLSHDLSKEKMPTCYFYLRGMCTKEDCPYLHVKLNEKTQVCLDFLKGYCEKGDECLKRHINLCPEIATRGVCYKKQCPYPHKSGNKLKSTKIKVKGKANVLKRKTKVGTINPREDESKIKLEGRYYKEVHNNSGDTEEACEVMKPTRCKLGTLPSFIQL